MYENVWSIVAPDEAVSFVVVKPLHGSLHFAGGRVLIPKKRRWGGCILLTVFEPTEEIPA